MTYESATTSLFVMLVRSLNALPIADGLQGEVDCNLVDRVIAAVRLIGRQAAELANRQAAKRRG